MNPSAISWLNFLQVAAALVQAAFPLPDWKNEEAVKTWLHDLEPALAKLIMLFTGGDQLQAPPAECDAVLSRQVADMIQQAYATALAEANGDAEAIDWKQLIDFIAKALVALFPQYATIIMILAEVIKQLLAAKAA